MACNCKHSEEAINSGLANFNKLRELFIKRMTVDSENQDRRRRDYNQAIFFYIDDGSMGTAPVWNEIDMDMVLLCFDNAVKDWRRTVCDVENCRRK